MTGYITKFDENVTAISLRANGNYNKAREKVETLIRVNFENKPFYGDYEKYIKIRLDSETEWNDDETKSGTDNDIYND